jgi:hypothetical protein
MSLSVNEKDDHQGWSFPLALPQMLGLATFWPKLSPFDALSGPRKDKPTMANSLDADFEDSSETGLSEPSIAGVFLAVAVCLLFVAATRLPVARSEAFDFDEAGYLSMIQEADFPKQHTLFLASAKVIGLGVNNPYRGFVLLDIVSSGLALAATWWMLRAVVPPRTAAAATLVLGVGPVFWSYGAMAANYTAIPLVGAILLGIVARSSRHPHPLHAYVAAVVLALGAGYRSDIGLLWLPVFLVILWQNRWVPALQALMLFVIFNFLWFIPMLRDAGGWMRYRAATAEFAEKAGWMNSIWNLGPIDASLRYAVKGSMALTWTLGVGLLFVPAGIYRLAHRKGGPALLAILFLAVIPALAMHLLVHFGVAGYAFHYVPSLVILMAIGFAPALESAKLRDNAGAWRGVFVAGTLAGLFWFYPTDLERTDLRGQFDLSFARHTRRGLATPVPLRDPEIWRTVNSQRLPGNHFVPLGKSRDSLLEIR